MRLKSILAGLIVGLFVCVSSIAHSADKISDVMSFQGVLKVNGTIVPNDNYSMTFKLYTVPTSGTAIWSEVQTVSTVDGFYNVLLGSVDSLSNPNKNVVFDGNTDYWLGVTVGNGNEMIPRYRLASSPYALGGLWTKASTGDNIYRLNGNVGIGTTQPKAGLHINKTDILGSLFIEGSGILHVSAAGPLSPSLLLDQTGSGNTNRALISSGGNLIFKSDMSEHMRIDKNGNVGIGTTQPMKLLHVAGDLQVDGLIDPTGLVLDELALLALPPFTPDKQNKGQIFIRDTGNLIPKPTQELIFRDENGKQIILGAGGADNDWLPQGASNTQDIYHVGGNVGIGTTQPSYPLDIYRNTGGTSVDLLRLQMSDKEGAGAGIRITNTLNQIAGRIEAFIDSNAQTSLRFYNFEGEKMRIAGNGNVGIGTKDPKAKLDVAQEDHTILVGSKGNWTNANGIIGFPGFGVSHGEIAYYPDKDANAAFAFVNSTNVDPAGDYGPLNFNNIDFVNIWARNGIFEGNVGIGTEQPTVGLMVEKNNGFGYAAWFRQDSSSSGVGIGTKGNAGMIHGLTSAGGAADLVLNPVSGNVGIGTIKPDTKLHVIGSILSETSDRTAFHAKDKLDPGITLHNTASIMSDWQIFAGGPNGDIKDKLVVLRCDMENDLPNTSIATVLFVDKIPAGENPNDPIHVIIGDASSIDAPKYNDRSFLQVGGDIEGGVLKISPNHNPNAPLPPPPTTGVVLYTITTFNGAELWAVNDIGNRSKLFP